MYENVAYVDLAKFSPIIKEDRVLQLLKYGKENRKYLFIQSLLAWLPKLSLSVLIYMILAENGFNITNLIAISVLVLVQVIYSLFFKDKVNNQYGYKAKKEFRSLYLNAFYKKDRDVDKAEVLQKEIMGLDQVDSFYQIFFPSLIQFMWGYIGLLLLSIHFGVNLWLLPFFYMISIGLSMAILGNGGKKKNRKFVEVFTSLGARFLNDLASMNTLIMYQADYNYQKAFEVESEDYRKR